MLVPNPLSLGLFNHFGLQVVQCWLTVQRVVISQRAEPDPQCGHISFLLVRLLSLVLRSCDSRLFSTMSQWMSMSILTLPPKWVLLNNQHCYSRSLLCQLQRLRSNMLRLNDLQAIPQPFLFPFLPLSCPSSGDVIRHIASSEARRVESQLMHVVSGAGA